MAVLNFRLLSRDSTDAYLAEGLAGRAPRQVDELVRAVSRRAGRRRGTPHEPPAVVDLTDLSDAPPEVVADHAEQVRGQSAERIEPPTP